MPCGIVGAVVLQGLQRHIAARLVLLTVDVIGGQNQVTHLVVGIGLHKSVARAKSLLVDVFAVLELVEPIVVDVSLGVEVQVLVVDGLDQLIERLVEVVGLLVILQQGDVDVRIGGIDDLDLVVELDGVSLLFVLHIDLGQHVVIACVLWIIGNQLLQLRNHLLGVALAFVDLHLLLAHHGIDTGLFLQQIELFDGFVVILGKQIGIDQLGQHLNVAGILGGQPFINLDVLVELLHGAAKHGQAYLIPFVLRIQFGSLLDHGETIVNPIRLHVLLAQFEHAGSIVGHKFQGFLKILDGTLSVFLILAFDAFRKCHGIFTDVHLGETRDGNK